MNDLDLARHRRQLLVLEAAAEERATFALYREALTHQQETDPAFLDRVNLGGGHHAGRLGAWASSESS